MSTVWIVSIVLQWVVIAVLVAVVLSLVRQLGALQLRLAGGLREGEPEGLGLYAAPEPTTVPLLGGGRTALGGERPVPALVAFLRPGCAGCAGLHAPLRALAAGAPDADVLLVLDAPEPEALAYRRAAGLERLPAALLDALPPVWRPRATPSALALAPGGVVAAEGRPRSGADLEALLHAGRDAVLVAGPDSVRRHAWGTSVPHWPAAREAGGLRVVRDHGKDPAADVR